MITRWIDRLNGTELQFLERRKESVATLLDMLQDTVKKQRKVPEELMMEMEAMKPNVSDELIVRACEYVKHWSLEELNVFNRCVVNLELATEDVTRFFHLVSGGSFPVVKSIINTGSVSTKLVSSFDSIVGQVQTVNELLKTIIAKKS